MIVKYLSPATSTFIIRVSRAHYRIAWAALSFMDSVPVKNGKNCIFRVVRVSGTIRKSEEQAIRSAREVILRARRELGEQGAAALDSILSKENVQKPPNGDEDYLMIHDSASEEEDVSGGDG